MTAISMRVTPGIVLLHSLRCNRIVCVSHRSNAGAIDNNAHSTLAKHLAGQHGITRPQPTRPPAGQHSSAPDRLQYQPLSHLHASRAASLGIRLQHTHARVQAPQFTTVAVGLCIRWVARCVDLLTGIAHYAYLAKPPPTRTAWCIPYCRCLTRRSRLLTQKL